MLPDGLECTVQEVPDVAEVGSVVEDCVPRVWPGVALDPAFGAAVQLGQLIIERVRVATDRSPVSTIHLGSGRLIRQELKTDALNIKPNIVLFVSVRRDTFVNFSKGSTANL